MNAITIDRRSFLRVLSGALVLGAAAPTVLMLDPPRSDPEPLNLLRLQLMALNWYCLPDAHLITEVGFAGALDTQTVRGRAILDDWRMEDYLPRKIRTILLDWSDPQPLLEGYEVKSLYVETSPPVPNLGVQLHKASW